MIEDYNLEVCEERIFNDDNIEVCKRVIGDNLIVCEEDFSDYNLDVCNRRA